MQTAPKAFIFDLDGLLLDTEPIYDLIFAHYARMQGVSEDDIKTKLPALRRQMYGKRKEDSARLFLEGLNIPATIVEWLAWREINEMKFFANSKPMPGAESLITQLQAKNMPLAIATSSTRELWQVKSQNYLWLKRIPIVVTGDEVKSGKPAPDIFLTAASRLQYDPAACLVFEDAMNGVAGALAAGMSVVFVPTGTPDLQEIAHLKQQYPDYDARVQVLSSLKDFVIPA